MKRSTRLCVLVWLSLALGIPAWAADAPVDDDGPPPEVTDAAEAGTPAETEAPGKEGDGGAPEVFVPTEEISEDFAVSFPVDI